MTMLLNTAASSPDSWTSILLGGFGILASVVVFLYKQLTQRTDNQIKKQDTKIDALEVDVRSMSEKLDKAEEARHESDKGRIAAEYKALLPCPLPECPKRANASFCLSESP